MLEAGNFQPFSTSGISGYVHMMKRHNAAGLSVSYQANPHFKNMFTVSSSAALMFRIVT